MYAFADRVKESTSSTGTGTFQLAGAMTGFRSFVDAGLDSLECFYVAESGADWEIGIGLLSSGSPDTLTRATVLASSNANALVAFAASPTVYSGTSAAMFRQLMNNDSPDNTFDIDKGWGGGDVVFTQYNGAYVCLKNDSASAVWQRLWDAFNGSFTLFASTSNATPTSMDNEVFSGMAGVDAGGFYNLSDNWINAFSILVEAYESSTGDCKAWEVKGAIKVDSGTPSIVGTVTVTVLGATAGAAAWDCDAVAGSTGLEVMVTGEAGKTIDWYAKGRI